ncbi:MAG TPA: M56 family metallopeptidase [Armatimonadota bacterium]|nr:M56 family metallopeptidase [Armatimonadota bacterium]
MIPSPAGLDRWTDFLELSLLRASLQGGLAIFVVWLLTRALPRLSPRAQSWLWRLAYLKLLIALALVAPINLPLLPPTASPPRAASPSFAGSPRLPVEAPALHTHRNPATAESRPRSTPVASSLPRLLPTLLPWIWLAGAIVFGAAALRDGGRMQQRKRSASPVEESALSHTLNDLRERLGIRRRVALLEMDDPGVPMLVGALGPAILLPRSIREQCSDRELELVLAHELAHLRRGDLIWSWLPVTCRILFFFHPLLWLADRESRHAQETACDEIAIKCSGAAPADYGSLLVKVAAICRACPVNGFAGAAAIESYRTLKRRITTMHSLHLRRHRSWIAVGTGLTIFGIIGVVPWKVVAQRTPAPTSSPPAQTAPAPGSRHTRAEQTPMLLAANPVHHSQPKKHVMKASKLAVRRPAVHQGNTAALKTKLAAAQMQLREMEDLNRRSQRSLLAARARLRKTDQALAQANQQRLDETRAAAVSDLARAQAEETRAEAQYRIGAGSLEEVLRARLTAAKAEANLHPGSAANSDRTAAAQKLLGVEESQYRAGVVDQQAVEDARYKLALAEAAQSRDPALESSLAAVDHATALLNLAQTRYSAGVESQSALQEAQHQLAAAQAALAKIRQKR